MTAIYEPDPFISPITTVPRSDGGAVLLRPHVDYIPVSREIEPIFVDGETVGIPLVCAVSGDQFIEQFPRNLWQAYGTAYLYRLAYRLADPPIAPAYRPPNLAKSSLKIDDITAALEEDPADSLQPFADPALQAAFIALDALQTDKRVLIRGHLDGIKVIRQALIETLERAGREQYLIDKQRALIQNQHTLVQQQTRIIGWWQSESEKARAREAALVEKVDALHEQFMTLFTRVTQHSALSIQHSKLGQADIDLLDGLCQRHLERGLQPLLVDLDFGTLDNFRARYDTLADAQKAIAQRIVDSETPTLSYHAETKLGRNHKPYLSVNFGFENVAVFNGDVEPLFADTPYDLAFLMWRSPGFALDFDPPLRLTLRRDSSGYPKIQTLHTPKPLIASLQSKATPKEEAL